jgi:hypothetical protein
MSKTSELTSFTKDVQGRYLCNDFFEAEAWRHDGGRPFDMIVIGGGTFGAAIAGHLWYRQTQAGGGLRVLVVEAGLVTLPEHVQNTGILGLTDPGSPFFLNESAPRSAQWTGDKSIPLHGRPAIAAPRPPLDAAGSALYRAADPHRTALLPPHPVARVVTPWL